MSSSSCFSYDPSPYDGLRGYSYPNQEGVRFLTLTTGDDVEEEVKEEPATSGGFRFMTLTTEYDDMSYAGSVYAESRASSRAPSRSSSIAPGLPNSLGRDRSASRARSISRSRSVTRSVRSESVVSLRSPNGAAVAADEDAFDSYLGGPGSGYSNSYSSARFGHYEPTGGAGIGMPLGGIRQHLPNQIQQKERGRSQTPQNPNFFIDLLKHASASAV